MFKNKHIISKRELLSLLGNLNFASRVIPQVQSFVAYLLSLVASVKQLHHYMRLNKECLLDIAMWHRFLTEWNGVALFLGQEVIKAVDFTLYIDAAAMVGYGGFFRNRWFQGRWPAELMLKDNEQLSIAFCELYPIVMSAILWGSEWKGKKIFFYCDSEATVHIINKGISKVQPIMMLMRCLTWCAASGNFIIIARHIPGINNNIADASSWFQAGCEMTGIRSSQTNSFRDRTSPLLQEQSRRTSCNNECTLCVLVECCDGIKQQQTITAFSHSDRLRNLLNAGDVNGGCLYPVSVGGAT